MFSLQSPKDPNQAHRRDRRVDLYVQCLAIKVVNDVEGSEATAVEQCIAQEVCRPDRVRQLWRVQRHSQLLGKSTFRLATMVQLRLAVHPVNELMIPLPTLAA